LTNANVVNDNRIAREETSLLLRLLPTELILKVLDTLADFRTLALCKRVGS